MNSLNEDLDDSALCVLSVIQKRKASNSISQKKSKQAKLGFDVISENGEQVQSDENLEMKKSTSAYFGRNNSRVCPLCLKVIDSEDGFTTHTKSCAKKHNMTTQELLKALDLQKKHIKERKELGLSSGVVPWSKKIVKSKSEKNLDSYDVALGIALSKSLEETKLVSSEKGKATLEEFGFKTTQVSIRPESSSRRNKLLQKSTLRLRTAEERQRIITEKIAVVLLDEDTESVVEENKTAKMELNKQLAGYVSKVSHLWKLGENEGKYEWYVKEIKPLIVVEEKKVSETCREEKTPSPYSLEDVQDALTRLNLPTEKLSMDWRKMINNRTLSDLVGRTKDSQTVYLHSLVLQARCSTILEKNYQCIIGKFSLLTVLIFLEFLYCGTLNSLTGPEVKNLLSLASEFDYDELIKVLNCLEASGNVEKIPEEEITVIESNLEEVAYPEDKDLFVEDMVDLTQSSHSTNDEKGSEDESDVEKSYWSFMKQEKKREEELREEEEKENSLSHVEREKIERNMKQRDEQMQKIMRSEEESDFRDSLELEKICGSQGITSPNPTFRDNLSDCIVLSSDSETRWSKPEMECPNLIIPSPPNVEYEIPCFDPYDNAIAYSELSPVDSHSQSLISRTSYDCPQPKENEAEDKPGYCSTPVTKRRNFKAQSSRKKPFVKKRNDLSVNRIIRKSLNLQTKRINSTKKKTHRRKSIKERESFEVLSNSALHDLSKSFTCQASTPKSLKNFVEITPLPGGDEFLESVTPSPNYSKMGDSVLKEHLARYGLKRSMGKSKAKKILRHIYEELHPRINTETGKIVKKLSADTPKRKKTDRKVGRKPSKQKAQQGKGKFGNSSDETLKASAESLGSLTDDSDRSEFEDLDEPLTQSVPSDPVDLPSAFREFIENNSEFHTKILLYEPIWLEDLQSRLKDMFKKLFKLSDLMDFLDRECITFRTHAQKRVNQKRAEMKKSPRKKK